MVDMPEHGDYDSQRWYCGYWMTEEEWLDIHDYSPPALQQQVEKDENEAQEDEEE
jgi:hypothetical protein